MTAGWTIGEFAARCGLAPKTIRYYEARGLLPAPARTPSGYRLYGPADLAWVRFVRQAKALGFSLSEIRAIVAYCQAGQAPCPAVQALVERKLRAVDHQIRALERQRQGLLALRQRAPAPQARFCGLIEGSVADGAAQEEESVGGAVGRTLRSLAR